MTRRLFIKLILTILTALKLGFPGRQRRELPVTAPPTQCSGWAVPTLIPVMVERDRPLKIYLAQLFRGHDDD